MSLQDDLVRWEAGDLSREELIASCVSSDKNLAEPWDKNLEKTFEKNLVPGADADGIELSLTKMLDLHERLADLGDEPVLYLESDWEELRASLPDRLPHRRVLGGGRFTRPLIAASMVVGLTAGAAAASPTVREHMVSVWHGIQHVAFARDPNPDEQRTPTITSPGAPGDHVIGAPVGTTSHSGGNPGHGNSNPGQGNPNPGQGNPNPGQGNPNPGNPNPGNPGQGNPNPGNPGGNSGSGPGNSDGTPGGGNSGSPGNSGPGNSDETPGGGNSGPGNSDGTPGGGNSGPGNSGDNPGGGNSGGNPGTPAPPVPPAPPAPPVPPGNPNPGDPGGGNSGPGNGDPHGLR